MVGVCLLLDMKITGQRIVDGLDDGVWRRSVHGDVESKREYVHMCMQCSTYVYLISRGISLQTGAAAARSNVLVLQLMLPEKCMYVQNLVKETKEIPARCPVAHVSTCTRKSQTNIASSLHLFM